ncbi:ABC transporter substrate-binding protein [Microbacterium rhizomatis]|uniref:Extracellular solute-binding protein n=1 Tax=Microbacterium rhizomatis TaxID=1631477 RepID=A0A5J5J0Z7_9MICO|nr:extracellular solute-binding protein [Microbacterium rhizomatis]KAA9108145.1 extracellular solute-binding protein [Microbacterium rhizomatis]
MNTRSTYRRIFTVGLALTAVAALTACAGGSGASPSASGGGPAGTDPSSFTVLTANENPTLEAELTALADGACKAQNDALPLEHQKVAQADVVQKVTLLASQDALPAHFIAGTAMVRPNGDLGSNNLVLDYGSALDDLGLSDEILPAAASTINSVYGQMVSLPYQYNIEGIWFNKEIFDKVGIDEPKTFDELLAANKKLAAAGYTPMAVAGAQAFPLTRILGMYIFRNVGPDAMTAIRDGKAKLTDPEYLAGAQALQQMAQAGDFGEGFVSMDAAAANNAFLTGKAAMKYDGSWLLANINDSAQNQIGSDNIGLMPFPAVDGGAGDISQWAANAGTAMAMSPKTYGPKVADWLGCIVQNYGAQALNDAGVISGFKVNGEVKDLPAPTKMVQDKVAEIQQTVLWFEALMDGKSTSLAQSNVSLLVTGQMTPEDYMSQLQASLDANK